jgi:hypothetical protein
MTKGYSNLFPFQGPQKFYPNLDFWFENKASGSPGRGITPSFNRMSANFVDKRK